MTNPQSQHDEEPDAARGDKLAQLAEITAGLSNEQLDTLIAQANYMIRDANLRTALGPGSAIRREWDRLEEDEAWADL